ncbi:MAG: Carnitine monooxygenase oxygenase subunit [Phycisphaerae bacterium]|nr:Carnitine monooxygenase oxygenase subunit [Phycisphaerae bacterium]
MRFDVDPDIRRATTPDTALYTDPAVWAAQRGSIFARSWQLVGHADQVRVPGQVQPLTLLEGCLDEPLLLTRDHQDRRHCLSNVCTHRGTLVCEHGGVERSLRCRYHGRRFALDGTFQHMPEFEGAVGFPSEADNLPRLALEAFGPLLFTSLQPAVEFSAWMEPVRQRVGWLPLDAARFDASRSRDYLVGANWALYCENYLEGFHIPFVHAGLAEALDYGAYRTELFRYCNLQVGVGRGGEAVFELPRSSPDHGQAIVGYYFWLFPNLMLNFYPWGLSVNVVKPLTTDRTRVSFLSYVWDESKLELGAGAQLDRVEREDESVVESVQRGVRARLYRHGRYSPTREQGTHHFHRLLAEFMS